MSWAYLVSYASTNGKLKWVPPNITSPNLLVSFIYTPNSLIGSVVTRTGNDIFCSLNFNYTESQGGEMGNKCKINVSNISGIGLPMLVF